MEHIESKNHPDYLTAVCRGIIEPGILPLTNALQSIGCNPLASCEGHIKPKSWFSWFIQREPVKPYVLFYASVDLAKEINRVIENFRTWKSFYNYRLTGYFHPKNGALIWVIEPCDVRLKAGNANRKLINADIANLANELLRAFNN
ncbi:hypothetical protein [Motilimonas eburnea]|uniref:hypothetical protein n=1 Tax=Motilimonas eburnea TaxID=1737488 RepID=UPI001E5AD7EC|nr:hypothetical protein [Motilimonas eburnea]MCE2571843.1 hypothetical protein [Motilimonas eburnea]